MSAKVGDRIVVESEKVGMPTREGVILEVIEASYGTRYRVRWDEGTETTIRPSAGSARTFSRPASKGKARGVRGARPASRFVPAKPRS
jgi:hypothetical protein